MMNALLLRLEAPMQAWGTQSRFSERDTQLEPSKSGVIGLLAAALGRRRHEPVDDLARLRVGIRVDREGRKLVDFHTVGGGNLPKHVLQRYGLKAYGVSRANAKGNEAAISRRYYLADAAFLVAVADDDVEFLRRLAHALEHPVFPLFLGRKSFVPSAPILFDHHKPIVQGSDLQALLEEVPWQPGHYHPDEQVSRWNRRLPHALRLVLEVDDEEAIAMQSAEALGRRLDIPISFVKTDRQFRQRHVRTAFTTKPIEAWNERTNPRPERSPST